MENKEMKNETQVKKQTAQVEEIFDFTEEVRDLKKVIKETAAKVTKKKRRNGEDYHILTVSLSPSLTKEVFVEDAELELMRMDRVVEVPAKFVEEVGKKSGNSYYRLYIDIASDYRKYVDFTFAEYTVLKRLFNLK